jgi:hypothetical protein
VANKILVGEEIDEDCGSECQILAHNALHRETAPTVRLSLFFGVPIQEISYADQYDQ